LDFRIGCDADEGLGPEGFGLKDLILLNFRVFGLMIWETGFWSWSVI
jgi:hypothetical protein